MTQNKLNPDSLRKEIYHFIAGNYQQANLDGISNHFGIQPHTQSYEDLKSIIVRLVESGDIKRGKHGYYFVEQNIGFALVRAKKNPHSANDHFVLTPVSWPENISAINKKPQRISIQRDSSIPARKLEEGQVFIAKISYNNPLHRHNKKAYKADILDLVDSNLIGVLQQSQDGKKYYIKPASRNKKYKIPVSASAIAFTHLHDGNLVRFNIDNVVNGVPHAQIQASFGNAHNYDNISEAVAITHNLSQEFNGAVHKELKSLKTPSWADRVDLTHVPCLTIDDITTKDYDDAISVKKTKNGWLIMVAIADVSQYIQWNGAIDKEARRRGNTTYLPGYTCHMIPEKLSTDLCSLVSNENRSALVMSLHINEKGKLISKKLQRAVIQVRANLHHKQVEEAMKGNPDEIIAPHMEQINAFYEAYKPLAAQARKRGQLPIESKEQKIAFDANGKFDKIEMREYLDINRIIEQFMVLANVAAAQILKQKGFPGIYRTHDEPSEKASLYWSIVLNSLGYELNLEKPLKPQLISILNKSKGTDEQDLIHMAVIRMQSKAAYLTDEDLGHYGLSLEDYAHFTSPIRRYADLIIHKLLIMACKLGKDGLLGKANLSELNHIAYHISNTERTSQEAERDVRERFSAAWAEKELLDISKKGEERSYSARIIDVRENEGLIVEIIDNGVQGFIPVENLPGNADYIYLHELNAFGTRENISDDIHNPVYRDLAFQRGAKLDVQLTYANAMENSIVFKPKMKVCAIIEKYRNGILAGIDRVFATREQEDPHNPYGKHRHNHNSGRSLRR